MPYEVILEQIPAGYTMASARKGEQVDVSVRGFSSTEDGELFVDRLDGFPTDILRKISEKRFMPSTVDHLLAFIYPDKKVKVFVNELEFMLEIQTKKTLAQGEPVRFDDIADIEGLAVKGIEIPSDIGLIFLFSIGWRKGLYHDFSPLQGNFPKLQYKPEVIFGQLYAYLSFQELFKLSDNDWEHLFQQQWFPFISLRSDTIKNIINHARNDWAIDELLETIRDETTGRFNILLEAWKKNPFIQEHYPLLEHAVQMYNQRDYLSTTAILYPRIEGIMRTYHLSKRANEKASQANLVSSVIDIGGAGKNRYSFLLPKYFDTYLRQVYFADFNPQDPKVISRHTVSHGVAPAKDFSLKSATIAFLIIDQLVYYLR